jgi:hypothetical protein
MMKSKPIICLLVFVLLLAGALWFGRALAANGALARLLVPPEPPAPEAILKASAETTCERFPGADAVVVAYKIHACISAAGIPVVLSHEYIKVLTEAGRRANELRSFPLSGGESFSLIRARIIKPDGRWVMLDPDQNSITKTNAVGEPGSVEIRIPGLEVGDLVSVETMRSARNVSNGAAWCAGTVSHSRYPVRHLVYNFLNSCNDPVPPAPPAYSGFTYTNSVFANNSSCNHTWELWGAH